MRESWLFRSPQHQSRHRHRAVRSQRLRRTTRSGRPSRSGTRTTAIQSFSKCCSLVAYQHDFAAIDADQGDLEEWNVRRLRLGPRITLFRTFTLHTEVELNPQERDPLYMRFTDAYLQWNKSSRLAMTFGKQGVPFTIDGATSSKELLTIDRSNLANNIWFPQEYMPGVSVSGRIAPWVYRGGVYSSGAMNREFGEFSGDYFTLALVGYDFAKRLGVKEAVAHRQLPLSASGSRTTRSRGSWNTSFPSISSSKRTDGACEPTCRTQPDTWARATCGPSWPCRSST